MKIQDFKTIMELQALKGLTTSAKSEATSTGDMFQQLLAEYMTNPATTSGNMQTLGSVFGQVNQETAYQLPLSITPALPLVSLTASTTGKKTDYDQVISEAASRYNLPEKLIKSVIQQESNFKADAKSHAGASGLMQLMPSTAQGLGVTDIFDPVQNIMAGSKYLSTMLTSYDGDVKLALAAYNAGPGNVNKYNGIPPFKETQNYVAKVMSTYLA